MFRVPVPRQRFNAKGFHAIRILGANLSQKHLDYLISKTDHRRPAQNAAFDEDLFGIGKERIVVRTFDMHPPLSKWLDRNIKDAKRALLNKKKIS